MLRRDTADGDAELVEKDITRIEDAADKMGDVLNELLELSRVGRVVNDRESCSFKDLAEEAIELLQGPINASGADVVVSEALGKGANDKVFGDRLRLREVLQNLIENAVRHAGPEVAPRIEVGVRHDANERVHG